MGNTDDNKPYDDEVVLMFTGSYSFKHAPVLKNSKHRLFLFAQTKFYNP